MTETGTIDESKVRVKRLNSEAGRLKLDLHDLAEDVGDNSEGQLTEWLRGPSLDRVAQRVHEKYVDLAAARRHLAELEMHPK